MSAPIIEVADEVVETINLAESSPGIPLLGEGITATREFNPTVDLKAVCDRRCVVYPARNVTEGQYARGLTDHQYEIQILIQEKLIKPGVSAEDRAAWSAQVEGLTELVDDVAQLFRGKVHMATTVCDSASVDIDPIVVPEHMDRMNLFSSVITVTFNQARTL